MAHFAQIDENNKVIQVLVVRNEDAPDETTGKEYLARIGFEGTWVQTSYNNNFRGKFATFGDIYDAENDIFVYSEPSFVEITEQ
jgi:hypothetical protein